MASQLMADETERSSSLSSSEPRRPRMKRPRGDWRRLPRERDRWRRLPRDDLGDCLGTQAVACPGAVVDMVEPMVFFSFGCFFQVLERPRSACCSRRRRRNPFAGASVAERPYWGRWVLRPRCPAVLRAFWLCDRGQRSAGWWVGPEGRFSARRGPFDAAFWLLRAARDLEKLCGKSRVKRISASSFLAAGGRRSFFGR